MEDGKVVIKAKVITTNFDKEMDRINKRLNELDEKANQPIEIDGAVVSGLSALTEEEQKEYDELLAKAQEIFEQEEKNAEAKRQAVKEAQKQTEEMQKQVEVANEQNIANATNISQLDELSKDIENMVKEYRSIEKADIISSKDLEKAKELKEDILKAVKKYEELGGGKLNIRGITDIPEIPSKFDIKDINNGLTQIVKKVTKWSLAVFGVRSAYSAIRSAMSTISQYDTQLADNIEYIRYALASSIQPVVQSIMDIVIRLLQYINYIAKAWTGKDLFKTADAFKDAQKNAKGLNKELNKTTASFDRVNVLSSQKGTGTSGVATPSADLTGLPEGGVPKWIEWIANNGKTVATIIGLIGAAIIGLKLAGFIKDISGVTKALGGFKASTGLALAGVLLLVGSIANLIMNWDTMSNKQKAISIALAALGASFIALGYAIATGLSVATLGIGAIIAAIVALVAAIGTIVIKWATEEKAIKSVEQAQKDLKTAQDEYKDAQDDYINAVDNATEAYEKLEEVQRKTGLSGEELYKSVQDGTLDYRNMKDEQKEVYKAYLENMKAQEELDNSTNALKDAKNKEKAATWEAKLAQEAQNEAFKDGGEKAQQFKKDVIDAWENHELSAEQARDIIGKSMSEMSRSTQEAFSEDIPDAIKNGLDPKNYETMGQKLSKWFSGVIQGIGNSISDFWNKHFGNSKGGVTYSSGSSGFAKGGVVYSKPLKLARGAVINQPGRGVPLTSAVGGERGQEGILPLTDSQQMEYLGQAIGRYVRINNYIENNMDSKRINRITQNSDNNKNFALNRG